MFHKLKDHIGHQLSCLGDAAEKVILFCVTCDKILVDANKTATPKKKKAFNMNKYKTHDGEKGSPQQWREAAKVVFNVNSENCLKTLGLSGIPASEDALKKHYKAIIRKAHPDLGGSEDEAARINAAYDFALALFFSKNTTKSNTGTTRRDTGLRPQLLNPITEEEAVRYLNDDDYCIQEKKDGKHGLIRKTGSTLEAANKQGLEMNLPPQISGALEYYSDNFVLDGEIIPSDNSYHIFDILEHEDESSGRLKRDLRSESYSTRHNRILDIIKEQKYLKIVQSHYGTKAKTEFFLKMKKEGREGVVFKRMSACFTEGRPSEGGDMVKCKFWATLSAIVDEEKTGKASFISYVFNHFGKRVYLGNCTALGKVMPEAGAVVEIKYLYAYKGGKLIQPVMLEIRDDVAPEECTTKQLKYKKGE